MKAKNTKIFKIFSKGREKIKKELIRQGRTQTQLAESIGRSRIHLYSVLGGRVPIGHRFIAALMRELPGFKFEDIFEIREVGHEEKNTR